MWGTRIKDLPFKLVVQSEIEIWRAADFWTKETETIAWIDSFTPGSVFWDIGANVGVFSLYAYTRKIKTVSFEPEKYNFIKLDENLIGNRRNDTMCVHEVEKEGQFGKIYELDELKHKDLNCLEYAISDFDGKSTFYVHHSGPGNSGGQVGAPVDEDGREFKPAESYEVETYKIDTLAGRLGVPNHIKIDVDGHEWRILQGGAVTLGNPEVKSVLVEANNCYADIDGYMKSFGFSDFNRFNGQDINRRANQKSRNVIYTR